MSTPPFPKHKKKNNNNNNNNECPKDKKNSLKKERLPTRTRLLGPKKKKVQNERSGPKQTKQKDKK